nr:IS30 family transposase [Macrococcus bovicus]
MIGQKTEKDQVLLILVESKSRYEIVMKIDGKQRQHVDKAASELIEEIGASFPRVFKSITSDNGSEFSGLSECLKGITDVYFTHPYSSWERGTKENQHRFIRRHISKGKPISTVTDHLVHKIQE